MNIVNCQCFALCFAQVGIQTDSQGLSHAVESRSNFAFLLLHHLNFLDNLVL